MELGTTLEQNIPLTEMIESLRLELAAARSTGHKNAFGIYFDVTGAEVELSIVAERKKGGGVSLRVLSFGAEALVAQNRGLVHKFKLTLKPYSGEGHENLQVAREFESEELSSHPGTER